jgi:hypothetical protein
MADPAFVLGNWNNGAGSSTTITYASSNTLTSGRCLVFAARWNGAAITATVADTFSNTYGSPVVIGTDNAGAFRLAVWVVANITGGANYHPTVTFSSATAGRVLAYHEVSGCATSDVVDASAIQPLTAPGTGANALTSGTDTTTVNNTYIFGVLAETGPVITNADEVAGTSFTGRLPPNTSPYDPVIATEDRVLASAGAVAATWTHSGAAAGEWLIAMVALKPLLPAQARRTMYLRRRR